VRLGVFGGAFNPPHIGHLICVQEACLQLGLDRALVVPTARPPHKEVDDEPGPEHRFEMCRRAVTGDGLLEVSRLELDRQGTSYTVDTLEALHSRVPDTELFLIVGGDAAAGLPGWRSPERILSLAKLAVADRCGTASGGVTTALADLGGGDRSEFFRMPRIEISSTAVRRRVREEEPIRYLVPDAVASYIQEHHLYGGCAQS